MTTRRGFLGAILAAAAAPAIVRASSLMQVATPKIITPPDPVAELRKVGEATTIRAPGSGLRLGDVITISGVLGAGGMHRQFVVSQVVGSSVLTLQAA